MKNFKMHKKYSKRLKIAFETMNTTSKIDLFPPPSSSTDSEYERLKEMKNFSLTQTDVSMTLAKQVFSMQEAQRNNVVFSPFSIHVILGVMAAGFGTGKCRDEALSYLKAKSSDEFTSLLTELVNLVFEDGSLRGGPCLAFANGMWVDKSVALKERFEQVVHGMYKAGIERVDFVTKSNQVCDEVNAWVKQETNGLITNLFTRQHVTPSTRLIFANALYFKGKWRSQFNVSETKDDKFFLLNGDIIQAPFIRSRKNQSIRAFDGFKVLRLPYEQGKDKRLYSMYIYLPDAKDVLPDLVKRFCSESKFIERHVPNQTVMVTEFRFPKFKTSFWLDAREALAKSGMPSAVCGHLTQIANGLVVRDILHKSFVEVNEEGTEAAAATGLRAILRGAKARPKYEKMDFVADHPFLFVVREDTTGIVLFVGQVLNPLVEE